MCFFGGQGGGGGWGVRVMGGYSVSREKHTWSLKGLQAVDEVTYAFPGSDFGAPVKRM